MIDIIIPAYNAHDTIKETLLSIVIQSKIKDINVYIIDAASEVDYKEEVEIFGKLMNIKQLSMKESSGPAEARQFGVDHTSSEYIMFLDADDLLYDGKTIELLENNIKDADMSCGAVLKELEYGTTELHNEHYSLHGKLYRRSVINKYNIRFDLFSSREANVHEDNSYNKLYELCCRGVKQIENLVYIYKYNPNSIVNTESSAEKSFEYYVRAMTWLFKQADRRTLNVELGKKIKIAEFLCNIIYNCYFTYLKFPKNNGIKLKKLSKIKKMYYDYSDYLAYEHRVALFNCYRPEVIPDITFNEFLNKIDKEKKADK